jgi:hypothetical protein
VKFRTVVVTAQCLLLGLVLALPAAAQEGHPLKGTWRGEIMMPGGPQPLVIIMNYDIDHITGMINPGRTSYNFTEADLDASSWTLHAEAQTREGDDVSFMAMLHDIGARDRYLEGMWSQAGMSYPFKITRE